MNRRVLAALIGLTASIHTFAGLPDSVAEAQQHAEKGVQCAQAGNMACAEAELRRAVQIAPNDASFLTSLGGILGMQQKFGEANVYFERAVKSDPRDTTARRNLAANQWRLGQLKQAHANLERLLRTQPHDKAAMLLLGMVAENEHDYARAARMLAAVPDLVEQHPESIAALASSYYHTGRRERAHELLEDLLRRSATPEGVFAAGGVAAEAEDYGIAEKLFQSIRSSYPDATKLEYNLALIQFRTQRIAQSEKALLSLINEGPPTGEVYRLLGRCYEKQNKPAEAVGALESAIRVEPSEESNYRDLLTILLTRKKLAAALEVARKAIEAFPQSAAAYRDRGMVEMNMNQFTDAVRSYSRAVELNPKSLDAEVGLASAKWAAGLRAQAEAEFQALLKQYPREASVYEGYATSLLNGTDDSSIQNRADALLKRAIDLDSSRPESHYQLGMLDLKKSNAGNSPEPLRQSLDQLEAAARLGLYDSKIHYALARVYRRLGREDDAAREMRSYQQLKADEDNLNSRQNVAGMPHE
ncbi:MAG: tetratricopeptide repeat protein [Bryobacteraceae bacterium]